MNTFIETLRNLGPIRLAAMVMVAAGILAFFVFLTSRLASPEISLRYAELDGQDSGQIAARLEQLRVPYRLTGDGSQIFVPGDQVARLRVAMAVALLTTFYGAMLANTSFNPWPASWNATRSSRPWSTGSTPSAPCRSAAGNTRGGSR